MSLFACVLAMATAVTVTVTEIQAYPATALDEPSDRFEVSAGGRSLFVARFHDVSYVRFAAGGSAPVEIRFKSRVRSARAIPAAAVDGLSFEGHTIRFTLLRPAGVAVLVNQEQRLFLLADPVESNPPAAGDPGVVSVTDTGADPSGKKLSTSALQKAIDAAAARAGGGTVLVPAGVFLTGTLKMRSHVTLHLAPGAVLRGSGEPAHYPKDPGRRETGSDESIASADQRYQGRTMTFSRLILFDGVEDARIAGRGTIDGNGSYLRRTRNAVPNLVRIRRGRRISIQDVLLRDAAAWTVHVLAAREVRLENVKILNDRANLNTDGVDVDSSQDVAVRGSFIHTKDDAVCLKATNNSDLLADVERVEVSGNVVSSMDAALKVGTESQAARFRDIQFRDNDVFDSGRAMSVVVRDGAEYSRIAFRDIRVGPGVSHLVEQVIGIRSSRSGQSGPKVLGAVEELTFENIDAPYYERPPSNWTWYAQFRPGATAMYGDVPVFQGADAAHAVRGLTLRNVVVGGVRLVDRETAERVANLTIGPFVEGIIIE